MNNLPKLNDIIGDDLDHEILPETHPPMYLMHKYFARKPANIIDYYIQKYSQKSEIVLDPFMGSGTTGVACKELNRKFIGIELEDKYFDIAQERIQKLTN